MLKHAKNRAVTIGKQGDNFDREKRGINVGSSQTRSLSRASVMLDERPFQLLDIDASGFSVLVPVDSRPPTAGASVDWTMFIGGNAISFGRATVGATSARRSGTVLRLNATSGAPDPALLEAHQIFADLRSRPLSGARLVPPEYKALCADIVARLRTYRKLAKKLDDVVSSDAEAAQDLFEGVAGMMASDWKAFSQRAAESVAPCLQNGQSVVALREFTQNVVTPELTGGAIWRRAFEKPRGYPGDYGVMNYCYAPEQIGATTYARLCHRLGIDFVECVRTRKNVVRDVIRERLERQSEVSAMSIACGSAHEIFELASCGDIVNRLQATLVDQDTEALNFAMARLLPYLHSDDPRLNATTVRAQFGDYTDPNGSALPAGQDLVYCFGMSDYLPDDLVAGIVPVLYSKLKPGGTLIVGNLRPAPEMIWPLCFVLGYDMWFRTAEEMLALAGTLVGCRAELKVESTGYNFLLFLHRQ